MRINFISVNIAYELKSNWITVANRFTGMFCCDECIMKASIHSRCLGAFAIGRGCRYLLQLRPTLGTPCNP